MVDSFKFTEQVNLLHPATPLAWNVRPKISDTEPTFLDLVVYQGTTFDEKWEKAIIDVKTHFIPKSSSIYIFTSYHPLIVKMDLTNWRSLKNPTNKLPWGSSSDFKKRLMDRGWPHNFERKIAIRSKTHRRKAALWNKTTRKKKKYCLSWHNTSP